MRASVASNLLKQQPNKVPAGPRPTPRASSQSVTPAGVSQAGVLIENQMDLMSIEDTAELLGVTPQTIRRWAATRSIPFVQVARHKRFLRSSIEAWIKEKEVKPWP